MVCFLERKTFCCHIYDVIENSKCDIILTLKVKTFKVESNETNPELDFIVYRFKPDVVFFVVVVVVKKNCLSSIFLLTFVFFVYSYNMLLKERRCWYITY